MKVHKVLSCQRKYAKNNLRLLLTLITAYVGFFLRLLSSFFAGPPDKLAEAYCKLQI